MLIEAKPYEYSLDLPAAALLIIDMQRDFLEPGGFGAMLGNDISQLRRTIEPNKALLAAWRGVGGLVIHTREGHRPDLADLAPAKKLRGRGPCFIGDPGPMGRILVRGEAGHDIIPELYPSAGEPVIDKPGKGAFFATDLHTILRHRGIQQLVVTGSRQKSASTSRCGRPTTAATTAWSWPIAAARTSRNSTTLGCG